MLFSRLLSKFRRNMSSEEEKMRNFLSEVQLDQFYYLFVKNLHLTRISHFDHVEEIDLTGIGMSKPEQRRLFEHLKKYKKPSLKKLFKKSFKRDSEKKTASPPSHESQLKCSMDEEPMTIARNNIRQGLKCLISEKDITLGEFLGKGAFGYVRKGVWKTDKGSEVNVAVKSLKPSHDEASVMLQNEFINEANAMSNLDHPNLIRLYGIVLTNPMMLVTELAKLGSLLVRLRQEPEKFLISILCSFVVQIVSGMKYLESNRFIHRDLAARNILLVSYEKIKIGDFGLMRALPSDADYYVMQPTGLVPFAWCATECLKYRRFSHASDVWAFGVTVLELFSYGREPWPGLNGAEILEKIDAPNFQRPDRPDHCPVEIYKIIRNCCWCDDPEERKSFEVLEKMILEALPKEQNASCTYAAEKKSEISFEVGDPLTIIEASNDGRCVKAQNRKNGQVGYIPLRLVSKCPPNSQSCDRASLPSVASSKQEAASIKNRKKFPETDSMSLVSRGSASSSGSDSSSGSAKYLSTRNAVHSNPRDIPSRRQSSLSSGYGSAGPSYSNSMKEDFFSKGSNNDQEYFVEDGPLRKTSTTYETIEEDTGLAYDNSTASVSISSYENVNIEEIKQLEKESNIFYENTEILSLPPCKIDIRHSSPISIRKPSIERHFSTASGSIPPQDETGSPTSLNIVNVQYIVSLPTNTNENESAVMLNSSAESELELPLSNSAPTTKFEIKAFRKASRQRQKNSANTSVAATHRSSFGSYKEKWLPDVLPQVHQMIDNSVYECMNIDKDQPELYELMTENNRIPVDVERLGIGAAIVDDTENTSSYENTTLVGENFQDKPPLPLRTHRDSTLQNFDGKPKTDENRWKIPSRTYRDSRRDTADNSPQARSAPSDDYENVEPLPLKSPIIPPKSSSVCPRTYNKIGEDVNRLRNSEYDKKDKDFDEQVNRMFVLPPRTYKRLDSSYENVEIPSSNDYRSIKTNYENYSLNVTCDDSPPPLPRKKSQKTHRKFSEQSTKLSVNEETTSVSLIGVTSLSADDVREKKEDKDGIDLQLSFSSQKCNLIDDSPIQDNLQLKYGTVWDGEELLVTEIDFQENTIKVSKEEEPSCLISENHGHDQSISETEVHKLLISEKEVSDPLISEREVHKLLISEKEGYDHLIYEKELLEQLISEKEVPEQSISEKERSGHTISKKELPVPDPSISEKELPDQLISEKGVSDQSISEKEVSSHIISKKELSVPDPSISEKELPDQLISEKGVPDQFVSQKEVTDQLNSQKEENEIERKQKETQPENLKAIRKSENSKPRSVSLLRALLSPTEHLNRKLERSSSDDSHTPRRSSSGDSPVPPPRRHRRKRIDGRRHTLAGSSVDADTDENLESSNDIKLPYDCAIEKQRTTASAPPNSDPDAPPLLPRDPCVDSKDDVTCKENTAKLEPKKIKIKSMLSEEVANFEEKDVDVVHTESVVKDDKMADKNEDDDKDNVRYVVHFVTPV